MNLARPQARTVSDFTANAWLLTVFFGKTPHLVVGQVGNLRADC
jgi:hypothetical protein